MNHTLVLTKSFYPFQTLSFPRALRLLLLGKAELVEEYDWTLSTVNGVRRLPAVIRLVDKVSRSRAATNSVRFSRKAVIIRDKKQCQYCGKKCTLDEITLDHVLPRSRGGKTCWTNIVVSCGKCNRKKDSKTPEEAKMRLLSRPIEPKSLDGSGVRFRYSGSIPDQWKAYVYWNEELES